MSIEKEAEAFVGQVHSRLRIKRGYLMRGEDMGYVKAMVIGILERKEKLAEGQKRTHSLFEALINTGVGFLVSMVANMAVLPLFGYKVGICQAFWIGVIFTGISIVRGYALRRLFNRIMVCQAK